VWCQDEAGPYQAIPQPGASWHPDGHPAAQPHAEVRGGTAKLLTLFRPATGAVRAKCVLSAPNAVLHPWRKDQLLQVLAELDQNPLPVRVPMAEDHLLLRTWQQWWWSSERPEAGPTPRDTGAMIWCASSSNTGSGRSPPRSRAPGSTWRRRCSASWSGAPSPVSSPSVRSNSSTGWSTRRPGGTVIPHRLSGMVRVGGDDASAHGCVVAAAQGRRFDMATQLPPDPLVA
jgi:hypothetical protein